LWGYYYLLRWDSGRKVLLILFMCARVPVAAQSADADTVKLLLERIDRLEKRVAELESAGKPAPAVAAAAVPAAPSMPGMPGMPASSPVPPPGAEGESGGPSFHLAGFSDLNFVASDQKGSHSGFNEGQFVLHMSSALTQKVSFFGELSFTARTDAGTGTPPATGFNVEVERSIIRYDYNDAFKLSFGRYHTPINYWNTAFHHGSWLQTTASRPEMVAFGGSFIPVHFIGALVEGNRHAGGLNLTYNVGLGNGRGDVVSRGGDAGDVNNNRAWLVNAFVKPDKIFGFQLGGSLYRDSVTPSGVPGAREWIESFHIVREKEKPEFIAEFANVRHTPTNGGVVSNSQAWYAQVAYRIAPKFKPYYRYEYIHVPLSDLLLRRVPGLNGSTAGIRYDVSTFSALKFEYRSVKRPGLPRANVGFMQTSFTF